MFFRVFALCLYLAMLIIPYSALSQFDCNNPVQTLEDASSCKRDPLDLLHRLECVVDHYGFTTTSPTKPPTLMPTAKPTLSPTKATRPPTPAPIPPVTSYTLYCSGADLDYVFNNPVWRDRQWKPWGNKMCGAFLAGITPTSPEGINTYLPVYNSAGQKIVNRYRDMGHVNLYATAAPGDGKCNIGRNSWDNAGYVASGFKQHGFSNQHDEVSDYGNCYDWQNKGNYAFNTLAANNIGAGWPYYGYLNCQNNSQEVSWFVICQNR